MPNTTRPADPSASASAEVDAKAAKAANVAKAAALDEVIRDETEAKHTEWRPRHRATVARRLRSFEEALQRNSVKPPPPRSS